MLNRRVFLAGGAGLLANAFLRPSWLEAVAGADPHFFLQVFVSGGMDSSYLFDARPLTMTQAGKIQNYLGREPKLWEGGNGQRTLATPLVDKLSPYRDRFSVINGVVMTTSFDGHPQNINYLFSGNPFGGDSFIPNLNQSDSALSLDAIQEGQLPGSFRNAGKSIPLSAESGARLIQKNRTVAQLDPNNPVIAFIESRMEANGKGPGEFSAASRLMARAYRESPQLSTQLAGIDMSFGAPADDQEGRFLELMTMFFKHGISRSAVITFETRDAVDTHDAASARRQPQTYEMVTTRLARIFKFLGDTEFLPGRSLWDFTTVSVASEFGRTMRQGTKPIDETGTDHNTLANSILLGGKGIRGDQVIGATDLAIATEVASPAHAHLDPLGVRVMARPFDFDRFVVRRDLPAEYTDSDYICIQSVVNSIYSVFGVPPARYWKVGRNGRTASVLAPLLL